MRQPSLFPILLLAIVASAVIVSAAPSTQTTDSETWWSQAWSAWELWLYRLFHHGHNPPGYPSTTSCSISATATLYIASQSILPVVTSTSASAISSAPSAYPSAPAFNLSVTTCSYQPVSAFPLSCSAEALNVTDTCCTTTPGGHLLLTQFWDTGSISAGPNNSWTIHGLWPDNCNGTYEQYCDKSRELTNITTVLASAGQNELLEYMNVYWKDASGNDESFYEHEYNKHGTCISGFEPKCFVNYKPQEEAVYFFRRAVQIFKTLPSFDWLADAGIVPSLDKTYTLKEITSVLEGKHGGGVNVQCENTNELDELWYHFVSQGSVVDGNMISAPLVGGNSTCPATGIRYLPKYINVTTPSSTASASVPSVSSASVWKGNLFAASSDGTIANATCIISGGSWYKGGTCAGFTLGYVTGGSYTLTSSKGLCAVSSAGVFTCSSNVTDGSEFLMEADGTLNLGGSTTFSADHVPTGSEKVDVYQGVGQTLPLTLQFKSI